MSVLTKEELQTKLKDFIGDRTDDDAIQFIEDVNDTYDDIVSKNDGEDWKTKYQENDAEWRKKYRDRFFSGDGKPQEPKEPENEPENKPKKIEDLFIKE